MTEHSEFWKRKLLAFLHDPPCKPFNIKEHGEIAKSMIRNAGFDPDEYRWFFDRICDHTAAAADRIVCPKSRALKVDWNEHAAFKHPLGGGSLVFERPIQPELAEEFVAAGQPHDYCWPEVSYTEGNEGNSLHGPDWAKFFIHWRLWYQACVERHPSLAHIPADTRIPDHTVWTHCSLVSALQGCVEIEKEGEHAEIRTFEPAFLLVQVGPVQEFISQARNTRDLWSGSYLLSWLVAHGIKAITDRVGPDSVLFPSLRGQPIFDFLHREELYEPLGIWKDKESSLPLHADEQIMTPSLPNRFLAVVPAREAEKLARAATLAMRAELGTSISGACLEWFEHKAIPLAPDAKERWRRQLSRHLEIHWQCWSWENIDDAIERFESLPSGKTKANDRPYSPATSLRLAYDAAISGIPPSDRDPRNYRHRNFYDGVKWRCEIVEKNGKPEIDNLGFAWAAHYAATDFLLSTRRNTRHFDAWQDGGSNGHGQKKDTLSGKEEAIGSDEWHRQLSAGDGCGHLFREGESLGAINLMKRIWHVAYLKGVHGLKRTPRFDSTPAVAAARLVNESMGKKLEQDRDAWNAFLNFQKAANKASVRNRFPAFISNAESEKSWKLYTDASVFHPGEWDRAINDRAMNQGASAKGDADMKNAKANLLKLLEKIGRPSSYVAILAMDGDHMGKWVSGQESRPLKEQLAAEAVTYFEKHESLKKLLETPRHVSPSYHLQFSEAVGNFSLYLAGLIVEMCHGQLVYAGGDDVLAMLPADQALKCACLLRQAFRGDPELYRQFRKNEPASDSSDLADSASPFLPGKADQRGFVSFNTKSPCMTRYRFFTPRGYHILVPGRNADVSCGIAIGHMHEPLQQLIRAAQDAEKCAKKEFDRAAFVMAAYKRSGEILEWGAKWDSGAIDLYDEFADQCYHNGGNAISKQFPYRLAQLLRPYYDFDTDGRCVVRAADRPRDLDVKQAILKEFHHVCERQAAGAKGEGKLRLHGLAAAYLDSLAEWKPAENGNAPHGRPIDDFEKLFLMAAFVHRGGGDNE